MSWTRPGYHDGYQRMSCRIDTEGTTQRFLQISFTDQGNLMRQKPGQAKNNIYDVKKWAK